MRILLLAAGAASRLHPLTASRPKPMVPVAGKPILVWCLEALRDAGLGEATVVVGRHAAAVQSHLQDGRDVDLKIRYVRQEQQIGSAHAVATALKAEGMPDSALVLGADNVVDAELVRALLEDGPDALAVAPSHVPARYGVVTVHGGHVESIREKPPVQGDALVWTGACFLSRAALDRVVELVGQGVTDLSDALDVMMRDGMRFRAVVSSGAWLDAVDPWDLVPLTDLLLARDDVRDVSPEATVAPDAVLEGPVHIGPGTSVAARAIVVGPTSIGANVRIAPAAVITRCLVLDDVKIGPGAILEGSVVAEGADVGAGAVLGAGRVPSTNPDRPNADERLGAVVGEGSTVGPGAVLAPGTLLGVNVNVAPGVVVRGRIPDNGWVL